MHQHDAATEALTHAVVRYAVDRLAMHPPPLDRPRSLGELQRLAGSTVTESGIGGPEALRVFAEVLAPACISVDHPRFLSFVPGAPTEASMLFDLVVAASNVYAGSWLEGAGAVYAENQALRWIADLAGLPERAGGVFVSGGTAGNFSSLVAARFRWRFDAGGRFDRTRALVVCSAGAHSSVVQATRAMDADVVVVPDDDRGKLQRGALQSTVGALSDEDRGRVVAVVATAGTTNAGMIDDLVAAADVAEDLGAWFHVDGAYGGAALAAPSVRPLFEGVERADSFIVDPHKWLFGPFDSCALIYREPAMARAAHTQKAEYLEVLHNADVAPELEWNPADYAHHLSRRARGLPLWFSLATHGTNAYRDAIETTLTVAREGARLIAAAPHLELLLEPELTIVMFRRVGWEKADYQRWSDRLLADGTAFVTPTAWNGETVLRICIVNPLTSVDDVAFLVESLA